MKGNAMTNELKGYSAKGKAKAALERQAAKLPEVVEVTSVAYEKAADGKWYGEIEILMPFGDNQPGRNSKIVIDTMKGFSVIMQKEEKPVDRPLAANKPRGPRGHSTIDGPCFTVWSVADNMTNAKRGEVIDACQALGVAYYTARTQYQKWLKARRKGDKSKPAKKEQQSAE